MKDDFIQALVAEKDGMENINLLLSVPETIVLAIGPPSCLRGLFFSARQKGQGANIYLYPVEQKTLAMGTHLAAIRNHIEALIKEKQPKALVVYPSCVEVLIGTDFNMMLADIKNPANIPIKAFIRGPLVKRRIPPKVRVGMILAAIIDRYMNNGKKEKVINLLSEEDGAKYPQLQHLARKYGFTVRQFIHLENHDDFCSFGNAHCNVATHSFAHTMAELMKIKRDIPYFIIKGQDDVVWGQIEEILKEETVVGGVP